MKHMKNIAEILSTPDWRKPKDFGAINQFFDLAPTRSIARDTRGGSDNSH